MFSNVTIPCHTLEYRKLKKYRVPDECYKVDKRKAIQNAEQTSKWKPRIRILGEELKNTNTVINIKSINTKIALVPYLFQSPY